MPRAPIVSVRGMTTSQTPTVGRMVHYQPLESEHTERTGQPWAATITEIVGMSCGPIYDHEEGGLAADVYTDGAVKLDLHVPLGQMEEPLDPEKPGVYFFAETPTPGHWNWPPRS